MPDQHRNDQAHPGRAGAIVPATAPVRCCGAPIAAVTIMLLSLAMAAGLWYGLVEAWR